MQLTPPGSACSIAIGTGLSERQVEPGSVQGMQIVVEDVVAAHAELTGKGFELSQPLVVLCQEERVLAGESASATEGGRLSRQHLVARARPAQILPVDDGSSGDSAPTYRAWTRAF